MTPLAEPPIRFLLVDDEPNILTSLRRSIQQMPQEWFGGPPTIEIFSDPEAALARASEEAFDLVVSDYRMPHMDGVTFLRGVKALQPETARIMLSGFADLGALVSAINDVQIFRFIAKPWDNLHLGAALTQSLLQRRLLQENRRLADQVRVQQGALSRQAQALADLERQCPGLTQVRRAADGAIELDEEAI